jgi:hypothetical protein
MFFNEKRIINKILINVSLLSIIFSTLYLSFEYSYYNTDFHHWSFILEKYYQFIKEADEVNPTGEAQKSETDASDSSKFPEVVDEIKTMIEKTIKNSGGEFKSFVDSLIKNPEDIKVEGFINDSDIYEFYLKFRNDIDELLNSVKYFDEVPSESNTFGLYDYIISGTERAVIEAVKTL